MPVFLDVNFSFINLAESENKIKMIYQLVPYMYEIKQIGNIQIGTIQYNRYDTIQIGTTQYTNRYDTIYGTIHTIYESV